MRRCIPYLICFAFTMFLAWLLEINPTKEYGWFMGCVQGALVIPNWIISLFDKGWLCKAPIHTTMYNVFWWIDVIFVVGGYILSLISIFIRLFVRNK